MRWYIVLGNWHMKLWWWYFPGVSPESRNPTRNYLYIIYLYILLYILYMYIYVLYVSCFAFSWWTDVGICREVFPARHKGGMMHHHHSCSTILPSTFLSVGQNWARQKHWNACFAPQKPSEPYAWKNSALILGDVLPTSPMHMAFIGQMKADKQLKTNTLT